MKRQTMIAIVAGALAVVLLWYFALYKPKGDDLKKANANLTQAEQEHQSLQATLTRLRALAQTRPQQEATLRRLSAAVPETPELAAFILAANQIASQSGIDWLSVAPTPPAANTTGGPSVVALSVQIQGGFFQVLDYLNRLEKLERIVVIDTINVAASEPTSGSSTPGTSSSASSTGPPTLAATLSARMFTRAAPSSGTAGPTAGGTSPSGGTSGTTTPPVTSGTTGTTGPKIS